MGALPAAAAARTRSILASIEAAVRSATAAAWSITSPPSLACIPTMSAVRPARSSIRGPPAPTSIGGFGRCTHRGRASMWLMR